MTHSWDEAADIFNMEKHKPNLKSRRSHGEACWTSGSSQQDKKSFLSSLTFKEKHILISHVICFHVWIRILKTKGSFLITFISWPSTSSSHPSVFPHRSQQRHAGPVDWVTLCNELRLNSETTDSHSRNITSTFNKMKITQIIAWFIESEAPDVFGLIVQQETVWEEDQEERSINVSQCVGWVNM